MIKRRMRAWPVAIVVIGIALFVGEQVSAQPPPPNFWKFQISNNTTGDLNNLNIELFATSNNYTTIDASPCFTLTVSKLMPGQTMTLGVPKTYGVAKIVCNGSCAGGKTANVQLIAPKRPPPNSSQYMGFSCERPPIHGGGIVPPTLNFMPDPSGGQLELTACARWVNDWVCLPTVVGKCN